MLDLMPDKKLPIILVDSEKDAACFREAGRKSVRVVKTPESIMVGTGDEAVVDPSLAQFTQVILAYPTGKEDLRDELASVLGDDRCKWLRWPDGLHGADEVSDHLGDDALAHLVTSDSLRPMWTDEVCRMSDIPDQGEVKSYKSGFQIIDDHGFRFVRPSFMPIIGPYGSGKSVLVRQLLCNLWRLHGWRCLITSFEEKVKPRYQRDLRRHLIGKLTWTDEDVVNVDREIDDGFRFLRRKRHTVLNMERLIDRIEYAVRIYGVDVVCIDPVNEIDHQVGRGESKTDYMGRFMMQLKQMADDYNLLVIVVAHPPKDGVAKRTANGALLTLNDGADTAHYGNKADVGWCVWRNMGPTYLHIDKLKDHEIMGQPTLVEMTLDVAYNRFKATKIGYDAVMQDMT